MTVHIKVRVILAALTYVWFEGISAKRSPDSYPQRPPELRVRQLCGQFQVLKADPLSGSLVPGKQNSQLESRHLQVILPHFIFERDLIGRNNCKWDTAMTFSSIGHEQQYLNQNVLTIITYQKL